MDKVEINSIIEEIKEFDKPIAFSGLNLPFNQLTDRSFEILLYNIFKDKIERDENGIRKRFDNVDLMQGVGEKGRDCILTKDKKNVGIIQCKKISSNISKPQFVKEIIKFLLHVIKDPTLINSNKEFTYFFCVSTGLAGTTKELIRDFNVLIFKEKEVENWVNSVISEYKQFDGMKYSLVKKDLDELLENIKLERILPQDIELWLSSSLKIQTLFFEVKTVTDNSLI